MQTKPPEKQTWLLQAMAIKGINYMCIEYELADKRLKQWADWLHEQSVLKQLGYPTSSAEQKIPGTGTGHSEKYNPEAEEVEQLLTELKQKWAEIYQALMACYFLRMTTRQAAEYNHISRPTFDKYYNIGMAWLEAKLT